jgi:pimeloyl-ACP methyl ester carboxylesterase
VNATDQPSRSAGAKPTVVLVHGAFADGSSWNGVIERLQQQGYPVIAPANPLRGVTADLERQLATSPVITVPAITLEGDANGAPHPEPAAYRDRFAGTYEHRTITGGIGHNLPHEAPQAFAQAVIDVASY